MTTTEFDLHHQLTRLQREERLPERPYPHHASRVEMMLMNFRANCTRQFIPDAHTFQRAGKLRNHERHSIARSTRSAAEVAADYQISEEYVRWLRRDFRRRMAAKTKGSDV